jgi:hypothetical protein
MASYAPRLSKSRYAPPVKKPIRKKAETVSLAPLGFEEAVRATLATGKAPPPPKKPKPKGKK